MSASTHDVATLARYAFAVARRSPQLAEIWAGDGSPIDVLSFGNVALLTCDVAGTGMQANLDELATAGPGELREDGAVATLARKHDAVVQAAFERTPVIPLRFGTVFRSNADAERWLSAREAALERELVRLSGLAEWSVLLHRPVAPASSPEAVRGARGIDYLAARREQLAARETRVADERNAAQHAMSALSRLADDVQPLRRGGAIARAAFLVRRELEPTFVAAANALADEVTLRVESRGPWAPSHFVHIGDADDE